MKINKVSPEHKDYPSHLSQIHHPPRQLFVVGSPLKDYLPAVAIVGSRKPSNYGREATYRLSYDLAKCGLTIVSGLALGVDGAAHRAALEAGGRTIAVMACGLDSIYPASHRNLAVDIIKHGGSIVSEYPAGTPALKQNFVARNRLVSGLADLVLITEAADKSGSLITASFGLEQNKPVGALPGSITSPLSVGCHRLIQAGALLVASAEDVLNELGWQQAKQDRQTVQGETAAEQAIIDALRTGLSEVDELQKQTSLTAADFSSAMTMLEITGKVRPLGGAHWSLK